MSTDAARPFFGRWKRVPREVTRNLSPQARRSPPIHTPTVATSTTKRIWSFMRLSRRQAISVSAVRGYHTSPRRSGNADLSHESGEPRVVTYPIPRPVHFEPHEPCRSLGNGQVQAGECLFPRADLR